MPPVGRYVRHSSVSRLRFHQLAVPPAIAHPGGPVLPIFQRHLMFAVDIQRRRHRLHRGGVGQGKARLVTGCESEIAYRLEIFTVQLRGGSVNAVASQCDRVRPRYRLQSLRVHGDPRHGQAIIKSEHKFHAHFHAALDTAYAPDNVRVLSTRRHEVGDADLAFFREEVCFQHHAARHIAALCFDNFVHWTNAPAAVLRGPQQRGEARGRGKVRPAQPINRTLSAYQGGCLAITDHGVVFNPQGVQRLLISLGFGTCHGK